MHHTIFDISFLDFTTRKNRFKRPNCSRFIELISDVHGKWKKKKCIRFQYDDAPYNTITHTQKDVQHKNMGKTVKKQNKKKMKNLYQFLHSFPKIAGKSMFFLLSQKICSCVSSHSGIA